MPVAAQLGGERPSALHRVDGERVGVADHGHRRDHRDPGVALDEHELAPVLGREAVDRIGLSARRLREAETEFARFEEVGLHVDHDLAQWLRRRWLSAGPQGPWSTSRGRRRWGRAGRGRAVDRRRRLLRVGDRRLGNGERPAGRGAGRARTVLRARFERGQAGRHPRRRQQEPAAGPPVPPGVFVGGGPRPAHRLGAQVVERRREELPVGARPELQRQPGIGVVTRAHAIHRTTSTSGRGVEPLLERRAGEDRVRARQQRSRLVELAVRVGRVAHALDGEGVVTPGDEAASPGRRGSPPVDRRPRRTVRRAESGVQSASDGDVGEDLGDARSRRPAGCASSGRS